MQDWLHGKLASYSIHILHKVYNIVYTDRIKNQAETTHQNWPKRPRAESTQAETTQAETTHGRNDSRPKRLTAETTRYRTFTQHRIYTKHLNPFKLNLGQHMAHIFDLEQLVIYHTHI